MNAAVVITRYALVRLALRPHSGQQRKQWDAPVVHEVDRRDSANRGKSSALREGAQHGRHRPRRRRLYVLHVAVHRWQPQFVDEAYCGAQGNAVRWSRA